MSTPDLIHATATVELTAAATGEGKRPRVRIVAYSGGVMNVPGWGPTLIDLARLKLPTQAPLLADHDNTLSGIVGHGKPAIENHQLTITGTLLDTEAARQVVALAAGGLELRASVGLKPLGQRYVQAGEELKVNGRKVKAETPLVFITRGALAEVSIVAVGADSKTAVSIAAKGSTMPDSTTDSTVNSPEPAAAPADALASERRRAAGILRAAHEHPEIAALAIAEGWDQDRTELEVLRAARPSIKGMSQSPFDAGVGSGRDLLACAMLLHAGHHAVAEKSYGGNLCERAAQLRVTSSVDLCRAALQLEHQPVPRDRGDMIRAAFSTNALSGALREATQREAMTAFTEAPAAWRQIARRRSAPDFRKHEGLRPYLKGGRLEKIAPDGEIKHAAIDSEKYPFQVHTFARMFSVDRQTIVNDDIAAVFELLRELGMQAARAIADEVGTIIKANPDGFFHNNNKNLLTGVESALSVESLGKAVQRLREQKDSDGRPIDVSPKTLLVPPALEALGRQVLNSQTVLIDGHDEPVESPSGNPWRGIADLAVDSRFAEDPTAWFLFADPVTVPAFVVSFLNGIEAPVVENEDAPFNVLGKQFRCYLDFGVDAADPRGAVKSDGE